MRVTVMQVGEMRMRMQERFVSMPMHVRFARRIRRRVHMLVVLIVDVGVFVFEQVVGVLVAMVFGNMKPHTGGH